MSKDRISKLDRVAQLDVDPGKIHNQTNMVRMDDNIAVKLAVLDAVSPGKSSKRSLVGDAVEQYYDQYFEQAALEDPLRDDLDEKKSLEEFL